MMTDMTNVQGQRSHITNTLASQPLKKFLYNALELQKLWIKHTLIPLHYKAITEEKSFMQTYDRNPLFKYATQTLRTGICNIHEFTN